MLGSARVIKLRGLKTEERGSIKYFAIPGVISEIIFGLPSLSASCSLPQSNDAESEDAREQANSSRVTQYA